MTKNEQLTKDIRKVGKLIRATHNTEVIEALQKLTVILESWKEQDGIIRRR